MKFQEKYPLSNKPLAPKYASAHTQSLLAQNQPFISVVGKKRTTREFSIRDSHMVTHCSTNRTIRYLFTAEQTGCEIFIVLWPNTLIVSSFNIYKSWGPGHAWSLVLWFRVLCSYRTRVESRINWTMRYVVGVAPCGKVWCFFCFFMTPIGAEQLFFCRDFHPFSEVGNSRLHSTLFNYSRFYGITCEKCRAPNKKSTFFSAVQSLAHHRKPKGLWYYVSGWTLSKS